MNRCPYRSRRIGRFTVESSALCRGYEVAVYEGSRRVDFRRVLTLAEERKESLRFIQEVKTRMAKEQSASLTSLEEEGAA